MIHQSYYRMLSSTPCNEEFKDRYLVVNCTGTCALSYTFATRGIREDYYLLYLCKGSLNVQIDGEMHTIILSYFFRKCKDGFLSFSR